MTWNFFKTNWFSIALVLLVLVAILRGSGKFSPQKYFSSPNGGREAMGKDSKKADAFGLASEPTARAVLPLEVDQATAASFLKRFAPVAIGERKKFGVPASVILATAFLNSHIGLDDVAIEGNNFFAIPCSKDWDGESFTAGSSCMRKYETAWASWRDFSIFLTTQDWYSDLRQSAGNDWEKWAKGMNGKGISAISNFGQKIVEVITYYHLQDLDQS